MPKTRREINAEYALRRKQAGVVKVCVWLEPDANAALDRLAQKHGSKNAAVAHALIETDKAESDPPHP